MREAFCRFSCLFCAGCGSSPNDIFKYVFRAHRVQLQTNFELHTVRATVNFTTTESIEYLLQNLRTDWTVARRVGEEPGDQYPQLLACTMSPPVPESSYASFPIGNTVPAELLEFWRVCGGAELFKDVVHGQWGLRLLSEPDAVAATLEYFANDFRAVKGDLVVGKFIGDSELLVVRANAGSVDFGKVVVVDEIHKRLNWLVASANFRKFLAQYARRMGRKFWVDEPVYIGGHFSH
jgi:hypothetical protein